MRVTYSQQSDQYRMTFNIFLLLGFVLPFLGGGEWGKRGLVAYQVYVCAVEAICCYCFEMTSTLGLSQGCLPSMGAAEGESLPF